MRVISGIARGHKLKRVPGDSTRPITDRVKENLFNILGDWVVDTKWLDLFAGTGQVGIEALSRGAHFAIFVDSTSVAIRTIRQNLEHTMFSDQASVIQRDAFLYLSGAGIDPVDVVYVAPPQYKDMWIQAITVIDDQHQSLLIDDGLVIVQIDPKEFVELDLKNLRLDDQRKYGRTMLCFYEKLADYSTST